MLGALHAFDGRRRLQQHRSLVGMALCGVGFCFNPVLLRVVTLQCRHGRLDRRVIRPPRSHQARRVFPSCRSMSQRCLRLLPLLAPSQPFLLCPADCLPGSCLFVRETRDVVYVHCWGGRGRAGTVGACLYLMLRYKDGSSFNVEVRSAWSTLASGGILLMPGPLARRDIMLRACSLLFRPVYSLRRLTPFFSRRRQRRRLIWSSAVMTRGRAKTAAAASHLKLRY